MKLLIEHIEKHSEGDPKKPLRQSDWAERFGISQGHLSDILRGRRSPGKRTMIRIEAATGGAVPVSAWFRQDT